MTTSTTANDWVSPGRNCGACGSRTCEEFGRLLMAGAATADGCPFGMKSDRSVPVCGGRRYSGRDVLGQVYDFVISAMPGESSARKIVLPFRSDLTERMGIVPGDIVLGRPAGAGCPIQHVISVTDADYDTGVITGHVVGPYHSRDRAVKDVKAYHMLGFEGRALPVGGDPVFGKRQYFLPGFCMMDRAHTGLVNMVIDKPWGIHVRVENVVIL